VEAAARLAHAHEAKLTIVHAFQARRSTFGRDAGVVPAEFGWLLTVGSAAEALVTQAADRAQQVACGGLDIHTRVEPGHAVPVLLAVIRELEPDAVVVGNADVHRARLRRSIGHALSRQASSDIVIVETVRGRGTRDRRSAA
jgi:nucleotide-binding universal stress UspA family protein